MFWVPKWKLRCLYKVTPTFSASKFRFVKEGLEVKMVEFQGFALIVLKL